MKKGKILLSGLLTVAILSIFTTVKAESYVVSEAPETFIPKDSGHAVGTNEYGNPENVAIMTSLIDTEYSPTGALRVIDYQAKTTNTKVFCINRTKDYAPNETYKRVGVIEDKVLAYIVGLSDSYYTNNLASTAVATNESTLDVVKKMEQSWLTQVAIWKYQNVKKNDETHNYAEFVLNDGTLIFEGGVAGTTDGRYAYSNRGKKLWDMADGLINQAKTAASVTSFQFDFEGNYELDRDNKTIRTGIITSPYTNFGLDLSDTPEGTKVFDESGNELDSANITTAKFYLVFPINNTEEYSFDFNVSATTKGVGAYSGYKYITDAGDYQPMMLVTTESVTGGINFKGSHIDDTASMISRSIYFVGFLILVAGVAMIYVNVRPQAQKEQI